MVNPYFCYGLAFSTALFLYIPDWSEIYPRLSISVVCFIVLTIIAHLLLGMAFRRTNIGRFRKLPFREGTGPWLVTLFLFCLWSADFLYAGGIPLFKILLRQPYDYKLFGIPTLHVFIVTFSSFYTVFLFHVFLSSRSRSILLLYLVNLSAAVLIYNRGMLLFNLSASAVLFLQARGGLSKKQVVWSLAGLLTVLFFFGMLGSQRVSNESGTPYTNDAFLQTGAASQAFRDSGIPAEFFWTYIYITSPLANLQHNIASNDPLPLTVSTLKGWVNNEVLFDFISKRINSYTGETRALQKTIPGPFNASTVYSGSYSYLGWPGLMLMAILILMVPWSFIKLLPVSSPFFLTFFALLNTIFLFMVFENTLRFTGLSFQLVYPLLLHAGVARWPWLREIFSGA